MKSPTLLTLAATATIALGELDHRPPATEDDGFQLTTLAFGSCCKHTQPQPIWDKVVSRKPDLFLWLGDNIYADTEDMKKMRADYAQLAAVPGYQALVKQCPVIATWDDHDYGANDAGLEFPKKAEAKELFLEFFNEPAGTQRHEREGVHTSYLLGPEGRRVQIILLDLRTFRTALRKGPKAPYPRMGRFVPLDDPEATMLGEDQWKWLEEELRKPADLRLIGISTQFVCEHDGFEAWSNMPAEKERFLDLLKKTRAEGVVFLSGDSHHGELHLGEHDGLYQLWELTSSSLNLPLPSSENQTRVGPACEVANFGLVTIDWEKSAVTLEVIGDDGAPDIAHTIPFSELTFADKNLKPSKTIADATGKWQTRHGELVLVGTATGDWTGTYGDGGRVMLKQDGEKLTGKWAKGDNYGPAEFTISRHGRFLRGVSGVKDRPALMNWCGWKSE